MTASPNLLELSAAERESLGLTHTLREILQQPETWRQTYQKVSSFSQPIEEFLTKAGLGTQRPLTVRHEVRRQLDLVQSVGCHAADERMAIRVPR